MTAAKKRPGRPPAGPKGEKVSKYHQLTIRVPDETVRLLRATGSIFREPMWRVVERAVETYVEQLPPTQRRLVFGALTLQRSTKGNR